MAKQSLLILGAGQFGTVVKEIAESVGEFDRIAFLDDRFGRPGAERQLPENTVGKLADIEAYTGKYTHAIVSIGNPEVRGQWTKKLLEAGYKVPVLISPRAYVSQSAILLAGAVIAPMAVINPCAKVGEGSFVMAGSVVDHNSTVGDYCNIHCGRVIVSNTNVSEFTVMRSIKD